MTFARIILKGGNSFVVEVSKMAIRPSLPGIAGKTMSWSTPENAELKLAHIDPDDISAIITAESEERLQ